MKAIAAERDRAALAARAAAAESGEEEAVAS
jgi:hypothetical protein